MPPWWEANLQIESFDHSSPELHLNYPPILSGSWFNYDEAHQYFQKLVDINIQFREAGEKVNVTKKINRHQRDKEKEDAEGPKNDGIKSDHQRITRGTSTYVKFRTYVKKGTAAWDIIQNRELILEYKNRKKGMKPAKFVSSSALWTLLMERYVTLIKDVREGRVSMKSNVVQGRIGNELKSREAIRKRNELDEPSRVWPERKDWERLNREFIQIKKQNTVEWRNYCAAEASKQQPILQDMRNVGNALALFQLVMDKSGEKQAMKPRRK